MHKAIFSILLIPLLLLGQQPRAATPAAQEADAAAPQQEPAEADREPARPRARSAGQQEPAAASPADAAPDPQASPPQTPPQDAGQQAPSQQQPAPADRPPPRLQSDGASTVRFSNLRQADLLEVVDLIARRLDMNYILDPGLESGVVSINTYGELTTDDLLPLLETILRMNGASAVKVGKFYRISPSGEIPRLPISPQTDPDAEFSDDERMILNVIRLRYTTASDISVVLEPFLGPGALVQVVEQGNLLFILDNGRNMRRTMELIALLDTEEMTSQRMRLFPVENSLASTMASDLSRIFAAFSFTETQPGIQFLPIERISSVLVVSGNPSVFEKVEEWIEKLDQPVAAGGVQTFVYRVQYGLAFQLAQTLLMLYSPGFGFAGGYGYGGYGGYGGSGYGGYGSGYGGYGSGYGGYGSGYGGYGGYGGGYGGGGLGLGGRGYGGYPGAGGRGAGAMGGYGRGGFGGRGYGGYGGGGGGMGGGFIQLPTGMAPGGPAALGVPQTQAGATDQTGEFLGTQTADPLSQAYADAIRIVPDEVNNLILVQSTKQEWEIIHKTLQQLDFPPRQVLIDAKIYEVALEGAFSSGVSAMLRARGNTGLSTRKLTGGFDAVGKLNLTLGALVGNTRELAAILNATQSDGRTRIISAPSVIATDNIPASITVGASVPTLSSQAVAAGAQQDGSSLFTNTVTNVQTGVTLSITPRVNASGIVTLMINQEVSVPLPVSGAIASPSIERRNVSTQITMADGDTVAIGGIMSETDIYSRRRVPLIGKVPILGGLFGFTSSSKKKTELIILITPRVIYDENEFVTMSNELKSRLRSVRRLMRE